MKRTLVAFLSFAAALSFAQVKMSVSVNGQNVGTAVLKMSLDGAGQYHQAMTMELKAGPSTVRMDNSATFDKNGRPIIDTSTQSMGTTKQSTVLRYSATKLTVTTTLNGKATTTTVALPKGNIADVSNLWFIKTKPKVGTSISYQHYNQRTKGWDTRTVKYAGRETVPGTKLTGNHVVQQDGDQWLDDKGMPIRLEHKDGAATIVLVRQ